MDRLVIPIILQILSLVYICNNQRIGNSDHGGDTGPSFNDLQDLIQNEDSKPFYDAIEERLYEQSLNLKEVIPNMFNEVSNGTTPQDLGKLGLSLISNYTSNFTYSNTNTGSVNGIHYGLFETKGTSGSYSSVVFNFIQGTSGTYEYHVGTCLCSTVKYSRRGSTLGWEGSTGGAFLFRMPSGIYQPYGSYAAITQASASVKKGLQESSTTLAIMNTTNYYSKTITNINGQSFGRASTLDIDMISLTGGTNATLTGYAILSKGIGFTLTMNGTLHNSDKEAPFKSINKAFTAIDSKDPLGKANLHNIFEAMYVTVGLYLP